MTEKLHNLGKETDIQIQKAQREPNKINLKRHTPRNIIMKLSKVTEKKRILKTVREKQHVMRKETPIRLSKFSAETLQARREWNNIIKMLKAKKKSC